MQETAAHKHWRWFFTLFLTVAGTLACIFVLPRLIAFFFPFVIGWILALMASPLARWLEKKLHIRKKVGSVLVVILVLAVIVTALYFLISRLVREIADFIPQAPVYLQKLLDVLGKLEEWLGGVFKGLPENVRAAFESFSQDLRNTLANAVRDLSAGFASGIGSVALSVPTVLFYTVITIASSFILIWERERLWNGFYRRMPKSVRRFIDMGKQSLKKALSGYLVAQLKMSWIVLHNISAIISLVKRSITGTLRSSLLAGI